MQSGFEMPRHRSHGALVRLGNAAIPVVSWFPARDTGVRTASRRPKDIGRFAPGSTAILRYTIRTVLARALSLRPALPPACELQLGFRLGRRASHLGRCGGQASRLGLAIGIRVGPAQTGSAGRARGGAPSFGQLSDHRADDVAVVVGPHPLAWVSGLGRPMPARLENPSAWSRTSARASVSRPA